MGSGMHCFRYIFIAAVLFQVLMMTRGVGPGEEDCIGSTTTPLPIPCLVAGQAPVLCYECISVSDNHFCADPFNYSHPQLVLKRCKEYCVKWTRKTLSGKKLVQRTCSSKLKISLRKTPVCIHESRPSEGILCFCNDDECNTASAPRGHCPLTMTVLALIYALFNSR